nr:unnamed protein product [uncultured bacterium]
MPKIVKGRHWAAVLYPESLPADWKEQLAGKGIRIAISPLHDRDKNPDGEAKKPHYHVILCFEGPTTFTVVKAITDSLGQPAPQKLESVKGYYRYLTHKDNPEKAQYNESDIETLNGFSIMDFADLTKSEVNRVKKELQTLILELNVLDYSVLMDYILFNGTDEQYDVASSNTTFFDRYLNSRWKVLTNSTSKNSTSKPHDVGCQG